MNTRHINTLGVLGLALETCGDWVVSYVKMEVVEESFQKYRGIVSSGEMIRNFGI